ncbi:MAG TPA: WYL domain-containing protein [Syntrophomonadaceae bacterium]|nr:WYL domain-containing protein [Syntrophomonadaceae bacterium]
MTSSWHNLFHESQSVRELPEGKLEVTYLLTGAQEMIPWLMSWGGAVEVLEPALL